MTLTKAELYGFEIINNWVTTFPLENVSLLGKTKPGAPQAQVICELEKKISLEGLSVLDLGCLEGLHAYILQERKVKQVVSIEGRRENFLKSLIIKNAFKLDNCEFLFGDVYAVMSSLVFKFDLCLASGILYHVDNPVSLLYRISQLSKKLFVLTHYATNDYPPGPTVKIKCNNKIYHGKYFQEDTANIVGSLEEQVFWLYEEDLLKAVKDAGFRFVEVIHKEMHKHGPALTFWATK
jgi:SAM-dependent methyltransferase